MEYRARGWLWLNTPPANLNSLYLSPMEGSNPGSWGPPEMAQNRPILGPPFDPIPSTLRVNMASKRGSEKGQNDAFGVKIGVHFRTPFEPNPSTLTVNMGSKRGSKMGSNPAPN